MGFLGIGRGLVRMAGGIIEGDSDEIFKGAKTTLFSTATTIIFGDDDDTEVDFDGDDD